MSETLPRMTEAEYLAWEERQDRPHEFDGANVTAMNGGTMGHERIQSNLKLELMLRLRGSRCEPFGPNTRVATGQGRYRYPDAVVVCARPADRELTITGPVVIFEILSESTYATDRGAKVVEYRSIPSLASYVMVDQSTILVTALTRRGELWSMDVFRAGDTLALPEIGIVLPVDALYAGLDLRGHAP